MDPTPGTTVVGHEVMRFSRTYVDHGVPMAMAVLAVTLALLVGLLAGYLLNHRR